MQREIRSGRMVEVLSYPETARFHPRVRADADRPALR